jgi:hypothetical protein
MCQGSFLDADSIAYSEILPRSGSMRSGVLYPQPTWEPPIFASGFSFWPSTRAEDAESCGNHPNGEGDSLTGVTRLWQTPASDSFRSCGGDRRDEMGLDQQARMMWPTPDAQNGGATVPSTERKSQINLKEAAEKLWPTPTEDNANNCGGPSRSREGGFSDLTVEVKNWPTLRPCSGERSSGANRTEFYRVWAQGPETAEKMWPTPMAADDGDKVTPNSKQINLIGASLRFSPQGPEIPDGHRFSPTDPSSRLRLNPGFAAWLMGMPWFWTNPESISSARSETESWRCRLRSRLESLLADSVNE